MIQVFMLDEAVIDPVSELRQELAHVRARLDRLEQKRQPKNDRLTIHLPPGCADAQINVSETPQGPLFISRAKLRAYLLERFGELPAGFDR